MNNTLDIDEEEIVIPEDFRVEKNLQPSLVKACWVSEMWTVFRHVLCVPRKFRKMTYIKCTTSIPAETGT